MRLCVLVPFYRKGLREVVLKKKRNVQLLVNISLLAFAALAVVVSGYAKEAFIKPACLAGFWVIGSQFLLFLNGLVFIDPSVIGRFFKYRKVILSILFIAKLLFLFGVGWYVLSSSQDHTLAILAGVFLGFLAFSGSNYIVGSVQKHA